MGLIYIGGYGRSGSTSLDLLLGQHGEVCSGGELTNFFKQFPDPANACGCGAAYSACSFWLSNIQVIESVSGRFDIPTRTLHKFSKLYESASGAILISLAKLFARKKIVKLERAYVACNVEVFNMMAEKSRSDTVVDSSKTCYGTSLRPFFLKHGTAIPNVVFVHLVRHPSSVANSVKKGTNKSLAAGEKTTRPLTVLRAYIGWLYANLFALALGKLVFKESYCLVRYEDLIANPEAEVRKILASVGKDMGAVSSFLRGEKRSIDSHLYEGNRMKTGDFTFVSKPQPSMEASMKEKLYFWFFCSCLTKAFGYK